MNIALNSAELLSPLHPNYRPLDAVRRNGTDSATGFEPRTSITAAVTGGVRVTATPVSGGPIVQPLSSAAIQQLQQYTNVKDDGLGVPFQIEESNTAPQNSGNNTLDAPTDLNQDENLILEITHNGIKGYIAWKIKELRKQVTDEIYSSQGITEESFKLLSPDKQRAIQEIIEAEVKRRLAESLGTSTSNTDQAAQVQTPKIDAANALNPRWTAVDRDNARSLASALA